MPTTRLRQLAAASIPLALCTTAFAQSAPARLGLCAACHGDRGVASAKTIPNLTGQNLDYLRSAIEQYRSGARDVPAMRAALGMLGATEADAVLVWYSKQTTAPAP